MAGTFSRIRDIFRAKANKVLDKAEDPRETLDLSYEKQLEQLQKVRRSVADVATASKRIELQAPAPEAGRQAPDAGQGGPPQGNEDLAREALARRAALGEQLADLKTQHDQIAEQEEKLVETSQELQAQVEQFRTQKETMKATYTAAEAQTKIGEAVSGISDSMSDAGVTMQRAQDKIAGMQARAGAMDELLASGALDRPDPPGRRHPGGARQGVGHPPGRQRAGRAQGRAGDRRRRRSTARDAAEPSAWPSGGGRRRGRPSRAAQEAGAADGHLTQHPSRTAG